MQLKEFLKYRKEMNNSQNDKAFSVIADIDGDFAEFSSKMNLPESVSILPVRNMVLFPGVIAPILVGRESSLTVVKNANRAVSSLWYANAMLI